jgi:hypothetical protein
VPISIPPGAPDSTQKGQLTLAFLALEVTNKGDEARVTIKDDGPPVILNRRF